MVNAYCIIDESGEIQYASNSVLEMFQLNLDGAIGLPLSALVPSIYDEENNEINEYSKKREPKHLEDANRELLARRNDGEEFPVRIMITEVFAEKNRLFIGIIRDLSIQGYSEKLVHAQRDQLAKVGRLIALGELTTSISHEINQPLTAIAMYATACQRLLHADDFRSDKMILVLQKLVEQSVRAGQVIEQIQKFVQAPESARSLVNLNDALVDIQYLVAVDAMLHGIKLHYDMTADVVLVRCDANQVQHVALNILRNAIEAMTSINCKNGGQISLKSWVEGKKYVVEVEDFGGGIPPERVQYIFKAFQSTKPTGIGLGLSICQSIIDDHGGELGFRNKADKLGCVFYFRLPIGE